MNKALDAVDVVCLLSNTLDCYVVYVNDCYFEFDESNTEEISKHYQMFFNEHWSGIHGYFTFKDRTTAENFFSIFKTLKYYSNIYAIMSDRNGFIMDINT
jgi:hypothetical protein